MSAQPIENDDVAYEISRLRLINESIKELEAEKADITDWLALNAPDSSDYQEGETVLKVTIRRDPMTKCDLAKLQQIDPELADAISKPAVDNTKLAKYMKEGFFNGAAASTITTSTKKPWVQFSTVTPESENTSE